MHIKQKVMEKYKNPDTKDEIMNSIKNSDHIEGIIEIIATVFPTWVIVTGSKFSPDYPTFQENWNTLCKKINRTPFRIIIVDFFSLSEEYSLIHFFCDVLTSFGFLVRPKEEFIQCDMCEDSIIPSETIYKLINAKYRPSEWSKLCDACKHSPPSAC